MADFDKNIKINVDVNGATKSINELEKEVIDLTKELEDLANASINADEETVKSLQKSADAKIKIIKANQAAIEKFYKAEADAAQKTADLIEKTNKEESDALQNSIELSKERTDQLIEAGVRVTQAFVTTTATIASFTSTEEDATRITANLAQAMAVADSIEQVYNARKAVSIVLTNNDTVAKIKNTTWTGLLTVATNGAKAAMLGSISAIKAFGAALQTAGGWIGLVITGLVSLGLYYASTFKSAKTLYELEVKQNDLAKERVLNERALNKAKNEKTTSKIEDDEKRIRQSYDNQLKDLNDFLSKKKFVTDALNYELKLAEKTDNQESITATKNRINEANILFLEAETEKTNIIRDESERRLDVELANFNRSKDLEITKLDDIKSFASERLKIRLNQEKELKEVDNRLAKQEISSEEALIEKQTIKTKNLQAQLDIINQQRDKISEINKQIRDIDDALLDLKESKVTPDIDQDFANQTNTIKRDYENLLEDITTDTQKALKELGTLPIGATPKDTKVFNDTLKAINDLDAKRKEQAKINQEEQTKVVIENTNQRLFIVKSAILETEALEIESLNKIKDSTKFVNSVRIDAANKILDIQLKIAAENVKEEIRLANVAGKTKEQINEIIERYVKLKDTLIEGNKEFAESLKLEKLLGSINKVGNALTKLSEIKVFSENNGINNFLNSVTSAEKALVSLGTAFTRIKTEFKKPVEGETPEQLKERVGDNIQLVAEVAAQAASEITNLINETVQAAFQANIDSFNKQLEVLNEKKAEINEDLQTSADKIKDLQGNLAQANIEDRSRIIKLIDIERKREKELQKQKAEAAKQELAIQEKIKEEKRKAFNAQKAASIAQAIISTALGVITPWTNPLTVTVAPALSAIIGALGAAQIGIIASQPVPEFKVGGFTERDNDNNKAVGVVHANEWVAPSWMVKSAKYKNTIQELESQRAKGYVTGGFVEPNETTNLLNNTLTAIQAISERPVVVSVQEINSVSNKVQKTQVRSTL